MTAVVALGGNALTRENERGTAAEQLTNLRRALPELVPLFEEPRVVLTHGNGPQVGQMLLRQERAADEVPPHPLWLAVAETQAEIGALIAAELRGIVERPVACVLTHVRVDGDDPAFSDPTKPIGPFYSQAEAERLERERGWRIVSDSGRGYRRVVPSPRPLDIVELDPIRTLLEAGTLAIACGGGGVPVVARGGQLRGVDAVIDKDWASALLAIALGAERLVILTAEDAVYRDFGGAAEEALPRLDADRAKALLPDLPGGSMRPKVEASLAFVSETGGEALVTSPEALAEALGGRAGTRITR
ncbi:MAG TPA: carbamate kinase [Gaiellaceae bacterium]|nr:carbamate kinase [Gaiellaceae bacterium]